MTPTQQHDRFNAWIKDHARILYHVANGFAEGADRSDLVQELMLALWRAVPAFQGESSPSTFIYRVAHNAALTWKRTQRNYRAQLDRFEVEALREPAADPAVGARENETLALIYAHIRRLPPVERSLILLHLDGVSYATMADMHGLTESNVGAKLTRLKQKLSDSLKGLTHELR